MIQVPGPDSRPQTRMLLATPRLFRLVDVLVSLKFIYKLENLYISHENIIVCEQVLGFRH